MTEKLPNIDAPQQDKTAEVAPLPKSAELLIKLNTLNFPDTQKNVLQSIISSRELEFKGTVRQNTVDVLYKNMQRLDNIASITTLPEQRAFLEEIKQQLNGVGSQHSQWGEYKKAQNEPGMESQRIVAGFFKGLIATGIAIKGLIDMKNGQQGLGALEAGLAAYILRVDKWLDPMNFLAKEVKFLQGQEWKNLKPKNVSQADWASLCGKIIQSNGAKTSSFDENQKQTWEKLTNAQKNRLETLLLSVKTDSGKQTVTAYLNGQSIRSTPTPKYSETPTAAPTKNTAPQGPTLAPVMPAVPTNTSANPQIDANSRTSQSTEGDEMHSILEDHTKDVNHNVPSTENSGMIPMRERFVNRATPESSVVKPSVNTDNTPKNQESTKAREPMSLELKLSRCNTNANEYNFDPKKQVFLFYEDGKMDEAKKLCSEHGIQNITVNEKFREIRGNFSKNVQGEALQAMAQSGVFEYMSPEEMHLDDINELTREQRNISVDEENTAFRNIKEAGLHLIQAPNEKTTMPDRLFISSQDMSFEDLRRAPFKYFGIIEFSMHKLPNSNTIQYNYLVPDSASGLPHELTTNNLNDIIKMSKDLVLSNQRRN